MNKGKYRDMVKSSHMHIETVSFRVLKQVFIPYQIDCNICELWWVKEFVFVAESSLVKIINIQ